MHNFKIVFDHWDFCGIFFNLLNFNLSLFQLTCCGPIHEFHKLFIYCYELLNSCRIFNHCWEL